MLRVHKILFCIVLLTLSGCTGLKRGLDGSTFVSTSKPAYSVTVPGLPLRTGGEFTASVTTSYSLGGVPVSTAIAVYGGETQDQPLAVVSQAEVALGYYWDPNLMRNFSVNQGTVVLGDMEFQACTYIVHGTGDAFVTLIKGVEPQNMRWVARRFASRVDFDLGKITLEYRERLPEDIVSLTDLPQGGQAFVRAFEERAAKAFVFGNVPSTASAIRNAYPEGIRTRYLNTNFFGTMSIYDKFE